MNAQQRGGERISARCATKHQIKKSDESDDEFCLLFLFSFFFLLKKFKKRRGGRRLGREGIASFVAHVLSFYEKRRIRVTRTNARDVSSTERSIQTHFSCVRNVSIVVVVLLLLHETKERYKREPIFEKNQPLNRQPS